MKKYLLAIFVLAVLVTPNFVPASAITKDELQQQISLLLAQIKVMQAQLDEMQGFKEPEWCYNFKNNLKIGDSGSDVAALQTALVKEGFSIEGDEVSSNFPARFNEATASAVTGFQQKYEKEILAPWGLKYGTGYVGRTTIKKLNELYGCGISLPRPTPPIPIPVPTIWPVPSPEPIPFPSPVKQPHYDAGPNTIIRGQQNYLNAVVKSSHVETPIFFYLQRPDGTMKYNAYEAGTTDAKGNFIKSFYERVDNEGQNGTWVSWVAVGGALSNKVYHKVIEKPTIVPIPPTPTPSITVLSPNGGETITQGTGMKISWAGRAPVGDDKYYVYLRLLNETGDEVLGSIHEQGNSCGQVEGNDMTDSLFWDVKTICANWQEHSVTPGKYKIGVEVYSGNARVLYDTSDFYFKITSTLSPTPIPFVTIYSISPLSASEKATVVINGSGFKSGASVLFNPPEGPSIKASGVSSNGTKLTFVIPVGFVPGTYRVAVTNLDGTLNSNEISFTVSPPNTTTTPSITVLSPNGGEVWQAGSTQTIKWLSNGLPTTDKMNIYLYNESSAIPTLPTLIGLWTPNDGSEMWVMPSYLIPGDKYRIEIKKADNVLINDKSDAPFSIVAASGGAVITSDSDNSPDYHKTPLSFITSEKYPDFFTAGVGTGIYVGASSNLHQIYGLEPDPLTPKSTDKPYSTFYDHCANSSQLNEAFITTDGKLGALGVSPPTGYTCSKGVFVPNTTQPSITVLSPNGGEKWEIGSTLNLEWKTNISGFDKYQIIVGNSVTNTERQLYDKVSVIDFLPVTQTNYTWTIPDLLSDFAKASNFSFDQIKNSFYLKIKAIKNDNAGGSYVSSSDKVWFSIQYVSITNPSITVLSPNGGEVWQAGSTQTIKWLSNGLSTTDKMNIYLYNESSAIPTLPTLIGLWTPNDGSELWVMPSYLVPGDKYRIEIKKADNALINDKSDAPFSIVAASGGGGGGGSTLTY